MYSGHYELSVYGEYIHDEWKKKWGWLKNLGVNNLFCQYYVILGFSKSMFDFASVPVHILPQLCMCV